MLNLENIHFIENNKTKKNKNVTTNNPRVQFDDRDYDIVFTPKRPFELFLVPKDCLMQFNLSPDTRKHGDKYENQLDLCFTLNGKKVRVYNFLLNPDDDFCVDHIGGNTRDNRIIVLRLATSKQNVQNRACSNEGTVCQHSSGKYYVVFPNVPEASDDLFDTQREAESYLRDLRIEHIGECSYNLSQEFCEEHETYLFHPVLKQLIGDDYTVEQLEKRPYVTKTPEKSDRINVAKVWLTLVNAEYHSLLIPHIKSYELLRDKADADGRREYTRIIEWLNDGRYVIELNRFVGYMNELGRLYAAETRIEEQERQRAKDKSKKKSA